VMRPASVFLLALVVLLPCQSRAAIAQSGGYVLIAPPIVDDFPTLSFDMEIYDGQGNFVEGILPEQVRILENGRALQASDVQLQEPGIQLTVVFNPGPTLENHTAGVSNFDRIQEALQSWVKEQSSRTPNEFSLTTEEGQVGAHLTVPSGWSRALEGYSPDLMSSQPGLVGFSAALNLASDPMPRPNMKRVILYITPTMTDELLSTFPPLTDRAKEHDVHVFVWLVGTHLASESDTAKVMQELAEQTGGEFFLFMGAEELPGLATLFQPLSYLYQVSYFSAVQESGTHSLAVKIRRPDFQAESEDVSFSVNVSPPNPIFLSPPDRLWRTWISAGPAGEPVLSAMVVTIQAIIEFPDGHERAIKSSRLYVDGEVVDENTEAPFDHFEWDLNGYTSDNSHMIQVEVEDSLGLQSASIEIPVEVAIEDKPSNWAANQEKIIGFSVLGAGVVLIVVLLLTGRRFNFLQALLQERRAFKDPVTQPVARRRASRSAAEPRSSKPRPQMNHNAPARLVRLSDTGNPLPHGTILLNQEETTLGSDPKQAICVLDSSSVSALHARLYRTDSGTFVVADAGSVAGTWVNYAPVSSQGARLENGDMVHIGRLLFRFELTTPPPTRQPVVSPYKEEYP